MHELAICCSLMEQLEAVARERNARRVLGVVVRVGPLAGVEPQLLRHAYLISSAGTIAEGSALVLEVGPVRVYCARCGAESTVDSNHLACPGCGNWRTEVSAGEDLILASVELERSVVTPITA